MGKCIVKKYVVQARVLLVLLAALGAPLALAGSWLDFGKELLSDATKSTTSSPSVKDLSVGDMSAGLKEALKVGTGNVVSKLGKTDGFLKDQNIRIPLPDKIAKAKKILDKVGMGSSLTELETRLNRAAEMATPKAKTLFLDAISKMTLDDAKKIYSGAPDAATQYFKEKMRGPLGEEMRPVIADSLNATGAVKTYDGIMAKYKDLPFVPDIKSNLTNYTVDKGMDGIFYQLAKEEAAIRANPVKRTTALLKKVFGAK